MKMRENSQKAEWAKSFDPGILAAKAVKQYSPDSEELRPGINARRYFNALSVLNNSDVDIAVEPDYNPDRRRVIPAHSAVPFTNITPYQGLNVVNLSTTTATAEEEVYITVRYERDILREGS